MTKATLQKTRDQEQPVANQRRPGGQVRNAVRLLACALCVLSGCFGNPFTLLKAKDPPTTKNDSLVLRNGSLEKDQAAEDKAASELESAKDLYRQGEHAKAQKVFAKIADNKNNLPQVAEEARYYEADCLRLQSHYPRALDTYNRTLKDFPSGAFHQQAIQRMFDIANYWLDETRDAMEARDGKKDGKGGSIWPASTFIHFDKTKPLLDQEGRAVEAMEAVYLHDPTGPLGEKALFYIGSVKFFREDYREADHYFNQIVQHYPNGKLAPRALELTIICKQMSTGGSDYDGRKLAEARELIDLAGAAYPEFATQKSDFLEKQLSHINLQQADKDYSIAEFYRRTGHPGSAYFYYEVVLRRYPGTKYAKQAAERKNELRHKAVEAQSHPAQALPTPPAAAPQAPQVPSRQPTPPQPEEAPAPRPLTPGSPLLREPQPGAAEDNRGSLGLGAPR